MNRRIYKQLLSLILSEGLRDADWDSFSPTDWDCIVDLAQAEGVAPLLYWRLSLSARIHHFPEALQTRLRAAYFSTRMNNEQIIRELESLANVFKQAGIPVVALKGACFALTIYPDLGLRPMADLDLLVPAAKHSEALQIARTSGYQATLPEASPGLAALLDHAACLKKHVKPFTTLELHTTLVAAAGSFHHAIPVDWFWSQIEPLQSRSSESDSPHLYMLTPTAQVLYAGAHAMLQHGGRNTSLRWLYDLDRLIRVYARQERIDWDLLLSQARLFAWGSALSAALSQTIEFFATPVPQAMLDELSRQGDRNSKRVATLQEQPATHILEEFQKVRSLNWSGKVRLIMALVAPSPSYMRWRYELKSYWVLPAWYVYRWWGIFKDGVQTVHALIQKNRLGSLVDRSPEKSQ